MFILTTAVPGVLLPTVRSRCMRLRFGRLTAGGGGRGVDARSRLQRRRCARAAPLADGSLGQALALIDNDLSMFRETGDGAAAAERRARRHAVARPGGGALHSAPLEEGTHARGLCAIVLRLMASMLRDLEAINAGADRAVLANPLLTGDLEALARAYAGDRARDGVWRRRSRAHRARAQRRHQGRHRVAGRADVMAGHEETRRHEGAEGTKGSRRTIGDRSPDRSSDRSSDRAISRSIARSPAQDITRFCCALLSDT